MHHAISLWTTQSSLDCHMPWHNTGKKCIKEGRLGLGHHVPACARSHLGLGWHQHPQACTTLGYAGYGLAPTSQCLRVEPIPSLLFSLSWAGLLTGLSPILCFFKGQIRGVLPTTSISTRHLASIWFWKLLKRFCPYTLKQTSTIYGWANMNGQTWKSSKATRFHLRHVLYPSQLETYSRKPQVIIRTSPYDIAYHRLKSLISYSIHLLSKLHLVLNSHLHKGIHLILDSLSRGNALLVSFPTK